MERVSVLCLSLLLCSLSGADLQDNEIIEQRKASPESVNVSEQPQPCPSDLHAVLRDMSTKLGKHEVRIEQLQTINQEQAAKLRELEKQTDDMDSMKAQLQVQAEKLRELEMQTRDVDPMKHQLQVHNAYLRSFKEILNTTINKVETLKRDKAVAFSAGLFASGSGYVGPYNTAITLVFRYVFTNIGNAYNPNTGLFIAPVRGAYHFEFYIGAGGHDEHTSSVRLTKNGAHVVHAYEHQTNDYGSTANGATLVLQAGDVVSLILTENSRIFGNEYHCSSYSGHLLFNLYD